MTGLLRRLRCRRWRPLLVDQAEGGLDARRGAAVERHCAGCARCAEDLRSLVEVGRSLRALPVADREDGFWAAQRDAVMRAVRRQCAPQPPRLRWMWTAAVPIAAVLVAAVALRLRQPVEETAREDWDAETELALVDVTELVAAAEVTLDTGEIVGLEDEDADAIDGLLGPDAG